MSIIFRFFRILSKHDRLTETKSDTIPIKSKALPCLLLWKKKRLPLVQQSTGLSVQSVLVHVRMGRRLCLIQYGTVPHRVAGDITTDVLRHFRRDYLSRIDCIWENRLVQATRTTQKSKSRYLKDIYSASNTLGHFFFKDIFTSFDAFCYVVTEYLRALSFIVIKYFQSIIHIKLI